MRHSVAILLLTFVISGCTTIGIGVGATVGAVIGSVVGTGGGAIIVGGALVGGLIGSGAGESQNEEVATEAK